METNLRLQVEKLEGIFRCYQRHNDELQDMNNNLKIRIKIHEIQKEFKEREIFDQKNDKKICLRKLRN